MDRPYQERAHPLLGKIVRDGMSGRTGVLKVVLSEPQDLLYGPRRNIDRAHVRMPSGLEFMTLPEYLTEVTE
ncbi:hypothetical protein ACN20G_03215 [Streptomyces sp. BI20]|uniref:hypothetical protein n=1 Tax=Streptomyces sp. BI20 TaxID=3403460 RepID=UPI003C785336